MIKGIHKIEILVGSLSSFVGSIVVDFVCDCILFNYHILHYATVARRNKKNKTKICKILDKIISLFGHS
jgi:hypothetical protein